MSSLTEETDEPMPEMGGMHESEGDFELAEEGEWKATGAKSMPGLDVEIDEPVPDMGEEVNI